MAGSFAADKSTADSGREDWETDVADDVAENDVADVADDALRLTAVGPMDRCCEMRWWWWSVT